MSEKHPYYNYAKLESYNATFNYLCGARGLGKTFGKKYKAIKDGIKKGDEFIYLRRYTKELKAARATFFADIEYKFPEYDFKISGQFAMYSSIKERDNKKRKWNIIGHFIALSTAQNQKSVAFPKVKTIIFDEFIIEKGVNRYLPDETTVFNNFYATVDRWLDKTRVYFLANSVSIMNPYFIEYEIRPDDNDEFIIKDFGKAKGFILAHFPKAENFQSSVAKTKFGQFISGSSYNDYAVGNTFDDNKDTMLALKDSKARYMFTLECKTGSFAVWHNTFVNKYYIQAKLPKDQLVFTLLSDRMDTHKRLMTVTDRPIAYLRTAFRQGSVSFDKPATRNTFAEIFKR